MAMEPVRTMSFMPKGANISKAADLGFETILFVGADALKQTLISRGIL